MKKTSRESRKEGRIINVASEGHRVVYPEGIRYDKINDELSFKSLGAYGQSKLANILHANELARRLKGTLLAHAAIGLPGNMAHASAYFENDFYIRAQVILRGQRANYRLKGLCAQSPCSILYHQWLTQGELDSTKKLHFWNGENKAE
ncbi:hypothetical protein RJ639_046981 [Escallonia herrerae]|uniref:Uncharacterized protein n=1 Tax=Escallonia herrerae TaxID=1293975 RepID=A0AA89AZ37_9ASTE|nr:hypothetical protein RJ639_046981 [Escallonia herrerae]